MAEAASSALSASASFERVRRTARESRTFLPPSVESDSWREMPLFLPLPGTTPFMPPPDLDEPPPMLRLFIYRTVPSEE